MTTANSVDNVYNIHKEKVLGENPTYIPASVDKRYVQGHYREMITEYARTSIPEEDAGRVRCSTFKSLNYMCKYIGVEEDVPESKVYPALRWIGYNIRYSNIQRGNPDGVYDMGELVRKCISTRCIPLMDFATSANIFTDTISAQYRMQKDVIAICMKDAEYSGIKTSEMNMYNVLEGVNTLILNEPDYINIRDDRIVCAVMDVFDDIKDKIRFKCAGLKDGLSNR